MCMLLRHMTIGKAIENINNSQLDKVIVTNTIPQKKVEKCEKIEYISVGIIIAEVIRRIENNESLSEIFLGNPI